MFAIGSANLGPVATVSRQECGAGYRARSINVEPNGIVVDMVAGLVRCALFVLALH